MNSLLTEKNTEYLSISNSAFANKDRIVLYSSGEWAAHVLTVIFFFLLLKYIENRVDYVIE